jgi:hypothetical protein
MAAVDSFNKLLAIERILESASRQLDKPIEGDQRPSSEKPAPRMRPQRRLSPRDSRQRQEARRCPFQYRSSSAKIPDKSEDRQATCFVAK